MKKITEAHFREIFHKIIYIELDDPGPIREAVEISDDADGILAYGFLEAGACMSFMVLAGAKNENGHIILGKDVSDEYCRVMFRDVEESCFLNEEDIDADLTRFDDCKNVIAEKLEKKTEACKSMLEFEFIDESRNIEFPEYVSLTLYNGKLAPEIAWVRPVRVDSDGCFYGYLASKPFQDYGLTTDQELMFMAYDNGQGGIQLMWDGREDE